MRKIFLVMALLVISTAFLLGCAKEEVAEISPELKAELDAELEAKLGELTPEERELVLGDEKALVGLAYYARTSIMSSSSLGGGGMSCTEYNKKKCGGCCKWVY